MSLDLSSMAGLVVQQSWQNGGGPRRAGHADEGLTGSNDYRGVGSRGCPHSTVDGRSLMPLLARRRAPSGWDVASGPMAPSWPVVRPSPYGLDLYHLSDASGCLLYVGITNNPHRRWRQHASSKRWWPEVASAFVEWFGDPDEARSAETWHIRNSHPVYNLAQSVDPFASTSQRRRSEAETRELALAAYYYNRGYIDALREHGLPIPEGPR